MKQYPINIFILPLIYVRWLDKDATYALEDIKIETKGELTAEEETAELRQNKRTVAPNDASR